VSEDIYIHDVSKVPASSGILYFSYLLAQWLAYAQERPTHCLAQTLTLDNGVRVYVCDVVYVYTYSYMYTFIQVFVFVYINVHIHTYTHVHTYVSCIVVYVNMHTCIYANMYSCEKSFLITGVLITYKVNFLYVIRNLEVIFCMRSEVIIFT